MAPSCWRPGSARPARVTSEALAAAVAALGERSDGTGYDHVMHMQASALLHAGMGHADMATDFMDKAVETVEAMAPPRGSANPVKPVHELYGELLLELDRPEDAAAMFETSLQRMANRPRSLLGLARANAAMGNIMVALENYAQVAALWEGPRRHLRPRRGARVRGRASRGRRREFEPVGGGGRGWLIPVGSRPAAATRTRLRHRDRETGLRRSGRDGRVIRLSRPPSAKRFGSRTSRMFGGPERPSRRRDPV